MKKRFLSIVGARPQFIKAALVSKELRKKSEEILVHTGQHYDKELSQYFFDALDIPEPDYNLGVGSHGHGQQTGKMLIGIEKLITEEEPDLVLVYGDTNSTLAGSLAAVKLGVRSAHVEAGLRSYDRSMPEEVNRVVADHTSDILFCPTKTSVDNLKKENITRGVHLVGDVMYDLALGSKSMALKRNTHEGFDLPPNDYLLVTVHRPVNTDDKKNLGEIASALMESDMPVIFPAHPRAVKFLKRFRLYDRLKKNIQLTKPVDYLDFLNLLLNCKKVATDSGGVQKEAYFFGKPCITLRKRTEWVETVEDGWNTLVGADKKKIAQAVKGFKPRGKRKKHYGNGTAVKKICRILEERG
ncbi:MAG: UDP-N-acetylglucosamine 2-epimerase (non-hydrolyzing) [Thermoplasmata archaeon]|nr:UDP-N-acetylglucosamine 2-epimerase (non-hydrolyzing) [Thermoplasmata archaeon]